MTAPPAPAKRKRPPDRVDFLCGYIMTLTENDRMTQMINGYWVTQIVHAAAVFSPPITLPTDPLPAWLSPRRPALIQPRSFACLERASRLILLLMTATAVSAQGRF
jgi:hypothetical protein